jgi:hypothetical protein
MAERRMFAKTIVTSDAFLDMPLSARCLYFTLGMFADDDGFVNNPKSIMRQVGASTDDLNLLLLKRFILTFESGIIVIKHWKIHNYIQKDRYKETKYIEEKATLMLDENGAYTECIQDVSKVETQVSIGKARERLGKASGSVADGYTAATTATTENVGNSVENPTDEKLEALGGIGKGVVFLTQTQFEDLLDKLGLDAFNLYVKRLADFIIDKNARIKSCYDTILKWVAEDSRTKGENK